MINKSLITFNRASTLETNADFGEKIGNFGLGLLRIGFGKTITVEEILDGSDKISFTEKLYSTSAKVAAVALFIFLFPVTIILSGIGYIGMLSSHSHGQIFHSYYQSEQATCLNTPEKEPNTPEHKAARIIQKYVKIYLESNISFKPQSPLQPDNVRGDRGIAVSSSDKKVVHSPQEKGQESCLNTPEPNKAATIIQKYFRGYRARKPYLPRSSLPQYTVQCKNALVQLEQGKDNDPGSMPRAKGGVTKVYLPPKMPDIVLKHSGTEEATKRFLQMLEVRSILNSQQSSHLIIPEARQCGEFLVEKRLPFNIDNYHQMGLYVSHPKLFDEAVREMARLFSKVYLSDLVSNQTNPLSHITHPEEMVRHDNLPLYIEEKKGQIVGRIGLIDLEHIEQEPNSKGLEKLARIFPLHLSVIREEAEKLKMEVNEASLQASMKNGIKYLRVGFVNHVYWLRRRGISTQIPSQSFEVSLQRIENLTDIVRKELLEVNAGPKQLIVREKEGYTKPFPTKFLQEPLKERAERLAATITRFIIENIKSEIKKNLEKKLSEIEGQDITESLVVNLRSLIINRQNLYQGILEAAGIFFNYQGVPDFLTRENIKFKNKYEDIREKRYLADQLLYVIMEELVRGGEIFYFDPGYYHLGCKICWIRY